MIKYSLDELNPSDIALYRILIGTLFVNIFVRTKEKIDKAVWFKESLIKRQITLKKVIKAIMSLQESYFLSGDISALKPMKLADVSELINMDVSTVSRVSNGKYIETSFGSFLMKELFSEAYKLSLIHI